VEGKILAIRFAREQKIPYFGICFGMQLAVIEFARHLAEIASATSEEFLPEAEHPVIYLMREWYDYRTDAIIRRDQAADKGGTMRLGSYPCVLTAGTLAGAAYGEAKIMERHRHRYEFNNHYREQLQKAGLVISGTSPTASWWRSSKSMTIPGSWDASSIPEFKSRPLKPHPLFRDYIRACLDYKLSLPHSGGEI